MVSRSIALLSSLTLFGVLAASAQVPKPALDASQIASYEGQNVTSVEVAGRPDLNTDRFAPTLAWGYISSRMVGGSGSNLRPVP